MERQSFHTGGWRTARWFWEKYMSKLKMKSWDTHWEYAGQPTAPWRQSCPTAVCGQKVRFKSAEPPAGRTERLKSLHTTDRDMRGTVKRFFKTNTVRLLISCSSLFFGHLGAIRASWKHKAGWSPFICRFYYSFTCIAAFFHLYIHSLVFKHFLTLRPNLKCSVSLHVFAQIHTCSGCLTPLQRPAPQCKTDYSNWCDKQQIELILQTVTLQNHYKRKQDRKMPHSAPVQSL